MLEDYLTRNIEKTEFSVSEISTRIKQLLEHNLGEVKIKGEISGLKIAYSGHGYFSLKDEGAVLAAICWRHTLAKINFKLEEGLEVVVAGKITAYAGQSKYQISVESIEPAGVGAFIKILTQRKEQLNKEGLFDKEHKKPIPLLPLRIGIITSISGAVIKDIIHRISDRFPSHLLIWPVSVQGTTSAREITEAIEGFNVLEGSQKPNLLIIARGGGSIEDLWSFNEEIVVRAAFNSNIPIISAVGHETDYTLLDLVADRRAPTPTAAAEFAVPVLSDLKYTIDILENRAKIRIGELIKYYLQRVIACNSYLSQLPSLINYHVQKIDDLSFRLIDALPNLLKQKRNALQYFPTARLTPAKLLKFKIMQYNNCADNLSNKKPLLLQMFENRLNLAVSLLSSMDYRNVIKRGFAMISNLDGKVISSVSEIPTSNTIKIKMRDGELLAKTNT